MDQVTIRLVSLVENGGRIRARLRADEPQIGVRAWLEVRFEVDAGTERAEWTEDAYDRVLSVLDPA